MDEDEVVEGAVQETPHAAVEEVPQTDDHVEGVDF